MAGVRKDGLDLIATAEQYGYTVVYTRDELLALPDDTSVWATDGIWDRLGSGLIS